MRKTVQLIILILSGLIFLASVGVLLHYWQQDRSDASVRDWINQLHGVAGGDSENGIPAELQALYDANPETVGWLRIDGTTIDYVVMQAPDVKEKYLHLDFNGDYSARGTLYVDERCDMQMADNIIIYGHHMNSGSMFAGLEKWADQAYYEEHPDIWLLTPTQDYRIVLFSGHHLSAYSDMYNIIHNPGKEMDSFLATCLEESDFQANVELNPKARYVMLSTCAYDYKDARNVLHGYLEEV